MTYKLIDLGKDGSKWKHGYIPENPAAVALKMHRKPGGGSGEEAPQLHHGQHVEFKSLSGETHHGTVQGRSNGNAVTIMHKGNAHAVGIKESSVRPLGVHEMTHEQLQATVRNGGQHLNREDIHVAAKRGHMSPEQVQQRVADGDAARRLAKAASDEIVRRHKDKKFARPTHKLVDLSKLTAKKRKALKPSSFALNGNEYPIPDENHARNALTRVAQFGTPEEQAIVKAAVRRKFPQIKVS